MTLVLTFMVASGPWQLIMRVEFLPWLGRESCDFAKSISSILCPFP